MKKFIYKIILFVFPILAIAVSLEISLRSIPNDYSVKNRYLDNHSKEIEILVLGSSHSFYGVNPLYFSMKSFNASHVSQSLDYDLEILKKVLLDSPKLRYVLLPISYFTFYFKLDSGKQSWRVKNYNIYYNINKYSSIEHLSEVLSLKLTTNLERIYQYYIQNVDSISCSELGWGVKYKSEKSKNLMVTGKGAALRHTAKDFKYLEENFAYLKSIVDLCQKRGVKVILFTPPAFKTYRDNLNIKQLNNMRKKINEITNLYSNCIYLDLIDSSLFVPNDFYDSDHLNDIGAKKLTLLLNQYILDETH